MGKRNRIGILGGTFNPPHIGHLVLAQESLKRLKLDKVIFIPTRIPPHKKIRNDNAHLRHKMVALACSGNPQLEVSSIELKRRDVSYSVDTLRKMKDRYGKSAELFFIAGSDLLNELESWRNIDEVLKLAHFVVAKRPGFSATKARRKIRFIEIPALNISSTMIRDRVRRSLSIRHLVPEPVINFIVKHKLYK